MDRRTDRIPIANTRSAVPAGTAVARKNRGKNAKTRGKQLKKVTKIAANSRQNYGIQFLLVSCH